MSYLIQRDLDRRFERAVFVVNQYYGKQGWVDPRAQVRDATGTFLSRHSCILSFAHGIKTVGYDVEMIQPIRGGAPIRYQFSSPGLVVLVYHLFGRSFALFQWDRLKLSLQQLPWQQRFAALETTARYYFDRPRENDIRLVL